MPPYYTDTTVTPGANITARMHYVSETAETPVTLMNAVYQVGTNNVLQLCAVDFSSVTVTNTAPQDLSATVTVPTDATKTYILKAFCWDGFGRMTPYNFDIATLGTN